MQHREEFAGRIAVVTGGSEGLGFDFCRELCQAGCEVYFCSEKRERGEAAAKTLGPSAHHVLADLRNPEEITAFADSVRKSVAGIDYLVNNVAIDDRITVDDLTTEECDRMWQVNLRSYLLVTRAFLDLLRAGQGKSVVNIGTTNYMLGLEPFTAYNATKSGILGFTRSLARELGRDGIRVNMLSPGWTMTEKQLRLYVTEKDKQDLLREQSLKFLLEPQHISPVVVFLLSSAAAAITGQNLVVDAGQVMS